MPKTPKEKIAELEAAREKLNARLSAERAKLRRQKRKNETRRKIVIGSVVLAHAEHDENFNELLWTVLKNRVIRPADRELLELPPLGDGKGNHE